MNCVALMKQDTKAVTSFLLGMLTFVAVKVATAETYYLSNSESSGSAASSELGFFTPSRWTPTAETFDSTGTYVVRSGAYRLVVAGADSPVTFRRFADDREELHTPFRLG